MRWVLVIITSLNANGPSLSNLSLKQWDMVGTHAKLPLERHFPMLLVDFVSTISYVHNEKYYCFKNETNKSL